MYVKQINRQCTAHLLIVIVLPVSHITETPERKQGLINPYIMIC